MKITKRALTFFLSAMLTMSAWAVPAYRGWQERTLTDGTPITIRQIGDEFYHFWETQDGIIALEQEDGTFVLSKEGRPTGEQIAKRRAASKRFARRNKKVGASYMPTRALFILVSFSNQAFKSSSETYYKSKLGDKSEGAMSMYNYLKVQSNGQYAPSVDVYGPYNLGKTYATYGANDEEGDDINPAQMIVDACNAANADIDFSQYDGNNDGIVDNVYVLYAGKGEADGGGASTVWPHQWNISYGGLSLTLDGKSIRTYACSAELNGDGDCAMGTPLHEYSHVIGLPDYYVTDDEAENHGKKYTPGAWSLMDYGSYNDNGNTPPNYSVYDKYYLGWATPTILKKDKAENVTLTTDYNSIYQITGTTSSALATSTNRVWYLENRQKSGWDKYLPGHGMVVWEVKYSSSAWNNNNLNNTLVNNEYVRYTLVTANSQTRPYEPCVYSTTASSTSGTAFPGTNNVTSYTPATGCALTEITESGGNISFKYNGGIDCHNVVTNGTGCTITPSTSCIENSTQLTATITPTDATYDFTSLTVKRGSTTLTSGYTLSSDKQSLTINASTISGNASDAITITVVWTKNRYSYAMLGENCTEELEGMVNKNAPLNLTITPDDGYTLADAACWEVTMGGNTLTYGTGFTYSGTTFSISSVTGDVEIYAYGGHTVTWSVQGITSTTTFADGASLVLPSNPSDCSGEGGKKFVGWTANSTVSGSAPSDLFTSAGTKTVTADITYYAVYATAGTGGGSATPTKATSIAVGDEVILVCENRSKEMTGFSNTSTIYGIGSNYSSTPSGSYTFEVVAGASSGTYALKHGSIYANWSSGNSLSSTSTLNANSSWNITFSAGNAIIANANTSDRTIQWNNSSPRFACYTSDQEAIQLYKIGSSTSYSDYTTVCGPVTTHTVTWYACGDVYKSEQYIEGAALVLPDPPGGNDGKTFAGWIATEHYTGASAPTFIAAGAAVNANVTYYAVFY